MELELDHATLCLGLVAIEDVRVTPASPELLRALSASEEQLAADPARFSERVRSEVRDVLRKGGYKPTGRGKPASEYLFAQAQASSLPRINNLVDVCNLASLRSALPISVLDAERLGSQCAVRFGRAGEAYVFNTSGQSMDIRGLPVVARGAAREPVANAVKDSMLCKVQPETRAALYVVYGSTLLMPELSACLAELSTLLRGQTGREPRQQLLTPSTSALST